MNHGDDSVKEILKRLEKINRRLSAIEGFLESGQEEKFPEEKIPEEGEVTYVSEEEPHKAEAKQKTQEVETTEQGTGTDRKPVTPRNQEKIWINILNKIGIFALIIGIGLFIKYSLPYIGLWGRIATGVIIGVGLLYLGEKLIKKYGNYALGISSCGIVVLYFSFYAASVFYDLFPPAVAFLLMLLVTVTGVLLSLRYDSSIISFIAVIGAFLTPYVFRGGEITPLALIMLFLYLVLIDGWILTVTRLKGWKWLNILSFSLTAVMLLSTIRYSSESGYMWMFLVFSTIFFGLFFSFSRKRDAESYIIFFLNPFLYYFILWFITYKMNPYIAGTLALALSAFYYYKGVRSEKKKSLELAWSSTGLAVFFLTIAIPIFFKSSWSTCAWAVEGTIILSLGSKEKILKVFALVLLGIAVFKMFFIDYFLFDFFIFFFNSFVVILSVFICARLLSKEGEDGNKEAATALNILGLFLVFWFTLSGTDLFFKKFENIVEMKSLVISILWSVYALVVFIAGIARENTPAKIAGFVMASLTIAKVFLYDMSSLETTYRIFSLVILGIILLTISFFYHKKTERAGDD